jgi:hypothetical protein
MYGTNWGRREADMVSNSLQPLATAPIAKIEDSNSFQSPPVFIFSTRRGTR